MPSIGWPEFIVLAIIASPIVIYIFINKKNRKEAAKYQFNDSTETLASPPEIQGWNWGAFLLGWVWGAGNGVWIAFLEFIPFVGIVMPFILGANGNKWAWRKNNYAMSDIERFKKVQRIWKYVGLAWWGFVILAILVPSK